MVWTADSITILLGATLVVGLIVGVLTPRLIGRIKIPSFILAIPDRVIHNDFLNVVLAVAIIIVTIVIGAVAILILIGLFFVPRFTIAQLESNLFYIQALALAAAVSWGIPLALLTWGFVSDRWRDNWILSAFVCGFGSVLMIVRLILWFST